jgi:histidyl-tRNA synthetase
MSKISPISGFPEWLPPQRMIEQFVADHMRTTFELYGFAPLDTRAVEPMDQLLRKGETSKEVYILRRLQADPTDSSDNELGLHFDLTVPFARFVLENAGKLQFPFRRYQIQKAWRGEKPQVGRYREFLQADIDVIDRNTLAPHHDADIALAAADVLAGLPIPPVRIRTNNRKVCEGFYRGLGIEAIDETLRVVDKRDKVGRDALAATLMETVGMTEAQAKACVALSDISTTDESFVDLVNALGVTNPLLDEGLAELSAVIATTREHRPDIVVADLSVARGLDYYTGTVYEIAMEGVTSMSVGAGGRYDNLATSGNDRYPGVGISLGISRLLGLLFARDALTISRPVPTCVLVAVPGEEGRDGCNRIAGTLRNRGIPTEVSPTAAKYGKQIRYAERRGIPYVWFPGVDGAADEVKDIRSGEQAPAAATAWTPPPADLHPIIAGA